MMEEQNLGHAFQLKPACRMGVPQPASTSMKGTFLDPTRRHRHRRPRRRTTDLSADRHAAHNLAAFGNDVVDLAATSQKLAHASINSYRVYQTCRRPEATATTQRNEE